MLSSISFACFIKSSNGLSNFLKLSIFPWISILRFSSKLKNASNYIFVFFNILILFHLYLYVASLAIIYLDYLIVVYGFVQSVQLLKHRLHGGDGRIVYSNFLFHKYFFVFLIIIFFYPFMFGLSVSLLIP